MFFQFVDPCVFWWLVVFIISSFVWCFTGASLCSQFSSSCFKKIKSTHISVLFENFKMVMIEFECIFLKAPHSEQDIDLYLIISCFFCYPTAVDGIFCHNLTWYVDVFACYFRSGFIYLFRFPRVAQNPATYECVHLPLWGVWKIT